MYAICWTQCKQIVCTIYFTKIFHLKDTFKKRGVLCSYVCIFAPLYIFKVPFLFLTRVNRRWANHRPQVFIDESKIILSELLVWMICSEIPCCHIKHNNKLSHEMWLSLKDFHSQSTASTHATQTFFCTENSRKLIGLVSYLSVTSQFRWQLLLI